MEKPIFEIGGGKWAIKPDNFLAYSEHEDLFIPVEFDFSRGTIANRVNDEGIIEEVPLNVPRIDYSDGQGCLLIEPTTTNFITYSEDFTQPVWVSYKSGGGSDAIITPNVGISPDGTQNADRVVFNLNGNSTSTDFSVLYQVQTIEPDVNYSYSIYLKSNTGNNQTIALYSTTGDYYSSVEVTNKWERFSFNVGGASNLRTLSFGLRYGNGISGVEDVADILVWGAQIEYNQLTSYIKTTSIINTRNGDNVGVMVDTDLINNDKGVFYYEGVALNDSAKDYRSISIGDGNYSNIINFLMYDGNVNRVAVTRIINTTTFDFILNTNINQNDKTKLAVSWDNSTHKLSIAYNGVVTYTETYTGEFTGLTTISFNRGSSNVFWSFYGKLYDFKIYKNSISDDELEILTQI